MTLRELNKVITYETKVKVVDRRGNTLDVSKMDDEELNKTLEREVYLIHMTGFNELMIIVHY